VEDRLRQIWMKRGPIAIALWPLAMLYGALVALRRVFFSLGLHSIHRAGARVIVVGNVVVGGAGKTPTTIGLAKHLGGRGFRVGIVSRGYGRESMECVEVRQDSSTADAGDEPLLLQRATGVPVFVSRSRSVAAHALLTKYPDTQIILCDDGLQHLQLFRDLEVCVFDARATGNGWLLPAGPLREPWPRKFCARAGQSPLTSLVLQTSGNPSVGGFQAQRHLADFALRSDGSRISFAELLASTPSCGPYVAVAGIAQPEVFFALLRATGIPLVDTIALSDHYDFHSFSRPLDGRCSLICTEKDASKLWVMDPTALAIPLVQVEEPAFYAAIDAQVDHWATARLSSAHGYETS
jgi:tetraacyldisaccharide 4'-kinase